MSYQSSISAENALLQFEGEYREMSKATFEVEQELNILSRQRLELQIKINDLKGQYQKGRENVRRIQSELRTAKTEYWRLRGENL